MHIGEFCGKIQCLGYVLKYCSTSPGSLGGSDRKNLPAVQETRVRSFGWEDPLEKEMATHSSILAWKIPWTEETGGLQSTGSKRVGHDWTTNTHTKHFSKKRKTGKMLIIVKDRGRVGSWGFIIPLFRLLGMLENFHSKSVKVKSNLLPWFWLSPHWAIFFFFFFCFLKDL